MSALVVHQHLASLTEERTRLGKDESRAAAALRTLQVMSADARAVAETARRRPQESFSPEHAQRLDDKADAAAAAADEGQRTLDQIRERLAEVQSELDAGLNLTEKDVKAHRRALSTARARVAKLEGAVAKQAAQVASIASSPDPGADLSDRRASLLAMVALEEASKDEVAKFDAQTAPDRVASEARATQLEEAKSVATALERALEAARQALADLEPVNRVCALAIANAALIEAQGAWETLAAQEVTARARVLGLNRLSRRLGGHPNRVPSFEPDEWRAMQEALRQLCEAHGEIFEGVTVS